MGNNPISCKFSPGLNKKLILFYYKLTTKLPPTLDGLPHTSSLGEVGNFFIEDDDSDVIVGDENRGFLFSSLLLLFLSDVSFRGVSFPFLLLLLFLRYHQERWVHFSLLKTTIVM